MNTYFITVENEYGEPMQEWEQTIKALTPGKAKYQAYCYWIECGWEFSFKDFLKGLSCKCLWNTKPSDYFSDYDQFQRTISYRNIPFVFQGMRVEQDGRKGFITGGNSSVNLDVLFDEWENVSNCHPHWNIKYFDKDNNIVAEWDKKERVI